MLHKPILQATIWRYTLLKQPLNGLKPSTCFTAWLRGSFVSVCILQHSHQCLQIQIRMAECRAFAWKPDRSTLEMQPNHLERCHCCMLTSQVGGPEFIRQHLQKGNETQQHFLWGGARCMWDAWHDMTSSPFKSFHFFLTLTADMCACELFWVTYIKIEMGLYRHSHIQTWQLCTASRHPSSFSSNRSTSAQFHISPTYQ